MIGVRKVNLIFLMIFLELKQNNKRFNFKKYKLFRIKDFLYNKVYNIILKVD